jgi:UDP-arabinose 4-epimerase
MQGVGARWIQPVTFDNLERGHDWAVKRGPLERGDLRDEKALRRAFERWNPCGVMHFAAYAYVGESNVDPLKYYDNNVGGTANLLKACAAYECKKFIFSSSCATYGIPSQLPLTEDHAQQPVNPYGYTKLVVERMLRDAEAAHGIRQVALRYFNAALSRLITRGNGFAMKCRDWRADRASPWSSNSPVLFALARRSRHNRLRVR